MTLPPLPRKILFERLGMIFEHRSVLGFDVVLEGDLVVCRNKSTTPFYSCRICSVHVCFFSVIVCLGVEQVMSMFI